MLTGELSLYRQLGSGMFHKEYGIKNINTSYS